MTDEDDNPLFQCRSWPLWDTMLKLWSVRMVSRSASVIFLKFGAWLLLERFQSDISAPVNPSFLFSSLYSLSAIPFFRLFRPLSLDGEPLLVSKINTTISKTSKTFLHRVKYRVGDFDKWKETPTQNKYQIYKTECLFSLKFALIVAVTMTNIIVEFK